MNASGTFQAQQAPCGKLVAGEHYEDHDDECTVTRETVYACGCKSILHEYHDGTVARRIMRHDRKMPVDEMQSGVY